MAKLYQKINGEAVPIVGGGGSDAEPYTVIVTLNEDFSGQIVSFEQSGQETLYEVCPVTAPYEVIFKPKQYGVWTVKSTSVEGKLRSTDTEELLGWGTYYVVLDNSFRFKVWLNHGRVTQSFDSLEEVLSDEKTLRQLFTVHDSVDYLVEYITLDDSILDLIIRNDLCAKWITLRDYALDTLYSDSIIKAKMDEVGKYSYGEWALMPQVPKMTSNTAPYGEVSASSYDTAHPVEGFRVFDNDTSTRWSAGRTEQKPWVQYKFIEPKKIKQIYIACYDDPGWRTNSIRVVASNTGAEGEWVEVLGNKVLTSGTTSQDTFEINADTEYLYYRVISEDAFDQRNLVTNYGNISEIQFYAWAPKGNVPIMTSNTAPYGEAFSSIFVGEDFQPYKIFIEDNTANVDRWVAHYTSSNPTAHIGYRFNNPVCVNRVSITEMNYYQKYTQKDTVIETNFQIQASNDGNDWTVLGTFDFDEAHSVYMIDYELNNDKYYMYYRIFMPNPNSSYGGSSYFCLGKAQFYGRELKLSLPTMSSNTEPYGEISVSKVNACSIDGTSVNNPSVAHAYVLRSGYTDMLGKRTYLNVGKDSSGSIWVNYKFPNKVKLISLAHQCGVDSGTNNWWISAYDVYGRNADNEFVLLNSFNNLSHGNSSWINSIVDCDSLYEEYRIVITDWYNAGVQKQYDYVGGLTKIDLFALDYSERDFDTESPRKYIYDHGVELEEVDGTCVSDRTNTKGTKKVDSLYVYNNANSSLQYFQTSNKIAKNNLTVLIAKVENYKIGEQISDGGTLYMTGSETTTIPDAPLKVAKTRGDTLFGVNIANLGDMYISIFVYGNLSTHIEAYANITEWYLM